MTLLGDNSRFSGSRPANPRRWLLEVVARFRGRWAGKGGQAVARQGAGPVVSKPVGGGDLALMARARRPLFDKEIIAAVCECPALTYELLVAPPEGVAGERVELDESRRPAAGLVRDERARSPNRRSR